MLMLTDSQRDHFERLFAEELSASHPTSHQDWLAAREISDRELEIRLGILEFDFLCRAGRGVPVELFLARSAALREAPEAVLQLIAAEIRSMKGKPDRAAYSERFPGHREQIEKLFELRELLGELSFSQWVDATGEFAASGSASRGAPEISPDETSPDSAIPQTVAVADEFRLLRKLASGNWKDTYEGRQASTGQHVAVKLPRRLSERELVADQMHREGQTQAILNHQSIPPVFAIQTERDTLPVLVEKLISGERWSDSIERRSLSDNLRILLQVARAAAYAHVKQGIIHRDIKPDNVMLNDMFGEVYLVDWGMALRVGQDQDEPHPTPHASGATGISGTPSYMAPEMALGEPWKCTTQTDVFLLGGMLYQVLTGCRPYEGSTVRGLIMAAARGDVIPPEARAPHRRQPAALRRICRQALSYDRSDRYADGERFVHALEAYLRHADAERRLTVAESRLAESVQPVASAGVVWGNALRSAARQAVKTTPQPLLLRLVEIAKDFRDIRAEAEELGAQSAAADETELESRAAAGEARSRMTLVQAALRAGDLNLASTQLSILRELPAEAGSGLALLEQSVARAFRQRSWERRAKWVAAGLAAGLLAAMLLTLQEGRRRAQAEHRRGQAVLQAALASAQEAEAKRQHAESLAALHEHRFQQALARARAAGEQTFHTGAAIRLARALSENDNPMVRVELMQHVQAALTAQSVSPRKIIGSRLAFDASGEYLATVDRAPTGWGRIWSTRSWELLERIELHGEQWVERPGAPGAYLPLVTGCAAVPGRPGEFISVGADGNLTWFTHSAATRLHSYPADNEAIRPLTCVTIRRLSQGMGYAVVAGDASDGSLTRWDWGDPQEAPRLKWRQAAHAPIVLSVASRSDGQLLASGGIDGVVRLWDPFGQQQESIRVPAENGGAVPEANRVALSPQGIRLAVGTNDHRVLVWKIDEQPPRLEHQLRGHESDSRGSARIQGIVFPSEDELLSSGSDGAIRLWTLGAEPSGRLLWQHAPNVLGYQAAFDVVLNAQCSLAASLGADGNVIVARFPTGEIVAQSAGPIEAGGVSQIQTYTATVNPRQNLVAMSGLSHDAFLRLIDANTMRERTVFRDQPVQAIATTICASALAISPDGQRLASGERDGRLVIWDASSGERIKHVDAHPSLELRTRPAESPIAFASLDWHPDGTQLVSLGYDGRCCIWNAESLERIHEQQVIEGEVEVEASRTLPLAKFLPNSDEVLILRRTEVTQWNPRQQETRVLRGALPRENEWSCAAFSWDGMLLALGTNRGTVQILETQQGNLLQVLTTQRNHSGFSPYREVLDDALRTDGLQGPAADQRANTIQDLAFSPDGRLLAVSLGDGSLRLIQRLNQSLIQMTAGHEFGLPLLSRVGVWFAPEGTLHSWGVDGTVRSWDLNPFTEGRAEIPVEDTPEALSICPHGQQIIMLGQRGTLWRRTGPGSFERLVPNLTVTAAIPAPVRTGWDTILATDDGLILAVGAENKIPFDRTSANGDSVPATPHAIDVLATSPRGDWLASNGPGGAIELWDLTSQRWSASLKFPEDSGNNDGRIVALEFNHDGTQLACARSTGRVGTWDTMTRTWLWHSYGPTQPTGHAGLQFSPDGTFLAQAGMSPGIVIWNAASGQRLTTLEGHHSDLNGNYQVWDLSWNSTPFGDFLASAGGDGTVHIWRRDDQTFTSWAVLSTRTVKSYSTDSLGVQALCFTDGGRRLLVGDDSQVLKSYDLSELFRIQFQLPVKEWIQRASRITGLESRGNALVPHLRNHFVPITIPNPPSR